MLWVVARNASGRPTLQHATDPNERDSIVCDPRLILDGWSRSYASAPIPSIACKKCLAKTGTIANPVRTSQPLHLVS